MIRYSKYLFSPLLIITLISFTCERQEAKSHFLLSKDNVELYDIVIYDTSSVIQNFAATELQLFLKKIFKAEISICNRNDFTGSKHFLLGSGFVNDSLFSTDTISKLALIQAVYKENIYLAGYDAKIDNITDYFNKAADSANYGTLYAAYDFLENEMGVHWFFPSYLGEFVPSDTVYSLNNKINIHIPAIAERSFRIKSLCDDCDSTIIWLIRNKANKSDIRDYNHFWLYMVPAKYYRDTLPSIFAQVDNKVSDIKQPQLCTTNDDLINLYIKRALRYFKIHPDYQSISLTPNDNIDWCECENCTALDTTIHLNPSYSRRSNRVFSFYKQLTDSILKYYPSYSTGGHAYSEYSVPLDLIDFSDQLHIRLAVNYYVFGNEQCSTMDTLKIMISEWAQQHNNMGFYSFAYGVSWIYPIVATGKHQELIQSLSENNFNSVRFAIYPDWYTKGLDMWLITKLLWDPYNNVDSLKQIYYESVFPTSKNIVSGFHTRLYERSKNMGICNSKYFSPDKRIPQIYLDLFDENELSETAKRIKIALKDNQLDDHEKKHLLNFQLIIDMLILEYEAYSNYVHFGLLPDKLNKLKFSEILKKLQKSQCISSKGLYFNPKGSPSLYIRNYPTK